MSPSPDSPLSSDASALPNQEACKSPTRVLSGSAYLSLPRPAGVWLVDTILPVGGTLLLYGDPKVGKSFAALQLAAALATGSDWLGFPVPTAVKVVYIQLDTPRSLWIDRVSRLNASGLPTDVVFYSDRELLQTWPFNILDPLHQRVLRETLDEVKPDVVILDTLREAHRGDENDSTDMQNVLSHLTSIVKPAALILVAHGKKASIENPASLINGNRGSNYVSGAVDTILHMTAKGVEIGGRAIEEVYIKLDRGADGVFSLADGDRVKNVARELLTNPIHFNLSLRDRAKLLASQTGKTVGACLSTLQRMQKAIEIGD